MKCAKTLTGKSAGFAIADPPALVKVDKFSEDLRSAGRIINPLGRQVTVQFGEALQVIAQLAAGVPVERIDCRLRRIKHGRETGPLGPGCGVPGLARHFLGRKSVQLQNVASQEGGAWSGDELF